MTRSRTLLFCSLLFAALTLVASGAHLAELPNKIGLAAKDYLTVQQIYAGWALFAVPVIGALVAMGALSALLWRRRGFLHALGAFLCIAGTQAVFWTFTFPANQATRNWTVLPDEWLSIRAQWEYSHAASAVLDLAALVIIALLATRRDVPL